MENEDTEYKSGDHNSFIEYVFTKDAKPKKSIKLELDPPNNDNNINKHIYEQLLQILVDGLKFLYGKDNKVDICDLSIDNILLIKEYFKSFNIELLFNMFTKENYVFKPYVYGNKVLENKTNKISEYYYEVQVNKENNIMYYRISFDFMK